MSARLPGLAGVMLVALAACADALVTPGLQGDQAAPAGGSSSDGGGATRGSSDASAPATGGDLDATADARSPADAGVAALINPAPGTKLFVGANFWNIDWEGHDDYFVSGVDFATTTNPWQPQLLADLAPYAVLRFMDWDLTNTSPNPQAVWSTRKQKTDAQGEAVAYEWQIDLCNRTKKDFWVNVPHEADASYWANLAALVKAQLDPSLRVYLEWSNEVWNGGFPQRAYATSQGQALGLAGDDPGWSFYVRQSVRVFEAFEAVFGRGSPRLVKVLAGQAAYTGPCEGHMKALDDATINPNHTSPDVYAIAPYFSGTSIADLSSDLATTAGWTTAHEACVAARKLPIIAYESGQDSYAAGSGCVTLQHDPAMHDVYGSYLDGQAAAGMSGPFLQYTHSGSCWGLKEKTGDSNGASPKYQGVIDWIAAHP